MRADRPAPRRRGTGAPAWATALAVAVFVALVPAAPEARAQAADPRVDDGRCQLRAGQWRLAAESLQSAYEQAAPGPAKDRAAAAWAQALLRLNRADQAEPLLEQAERSALPLRERAAAALELGTLHLARGQAARAESALGRALALADGDPEVALAVELNRIRSAPEAERLPRLQAAAAQLPTLGEGPAAARHALNLAAQAQPLGPEGLALAGRQLEVARVRAVSLGDGALTAEAYDGLSALAEAAGRPEDALRLAERGLRHAQTLTARELAVPLEWRAARMARALGRDDLALDAYRRAVEAIEAVRGDIPVQYQDGRSSFRDTLEPVYLGLTDLLLRRAATAPEDRPALLRQARDTVELIKQTELEDYLRDRCSLGGTRRAVSQAPQAGTAIYYPIILPDRLELLVETAQGITATPVAVNAELLRRSTLNFVTALRNRSAFRAQAERLYGWLLKPVQARLQAERVHTLVAVPDGVLRLVPLAALHDGQDFVIRRLAVATVPGLSITPAAPARAAPRGALLAGLSEPGPVVEKLPAAVIATVLEPENEAARAATRGDLPALRTQAVRDALRDALSLPGVRQELVDIGQALQSRPLLDRDFTLAALQGALRDGDPAIVHIASHGVFGDSADTTFIMTYDELLTLDGLQRLLGRDRARRAPIELITLSACQTAEGDDRAPLGMSGTAIKARARSALGTLWPVSDAAAQRVMSAFYRGLAARSDATRPGGKIGALRDAQLQLLDQATTRHPFYWAPFVLVGDWS